jgi:L-lactate dehydrogenase
MMNNFGIIGFGEVGVTVASLINTCFQHVKIQIYDTDTEINGRILDFAHACAVNQNELSVNSYPTSSEIDYLIYAAGYSNKKGESRESVAEANRFLVDEIFQNFEVKESAKIIVITNPVEKISYWIQQMKPNNLVIGTGTSLDTFRLNYIVAKRLALPIQSINTMVIGEHGNGMVPVFSNSYVNEENIGNYFSEQELNEITSELKNAATKIRETEKATKFGVAETTLKILKAFIEHNQTSIELSVPINQYFIEYLEISNSDFFISLPCLIENGKIKVNKLVLNEDEKLQLKQSVKALMIS